MKLTEQEISKILENLASSSRRQANGNRDPSSGFLLDFIDIDSFIKLIYSILKSNGHLMSLDDSENDKNDLSKFIFTEEHPDVALGKERIVSVDISRRTPANLSAGAHPFSGTTAYRPVYLGQEKDPVHGGVNIDLQFMYDNELSITCWANKLKSARMLATLFESIMNKYYWVLRKHVPIVIYTGRGPTIFSEELGDLRYFGIPLNFFIRTNERFILKEKELRCIKIDYELANKGALHG